MSKTEFNFYSKLNKEKSLTTRSIPDSILKSQIFTSLINSKIVEKSTKGRGFRYEIIMQDDYDRFFNEKFPKKDIDVYDEIDSQLKYRDTKAVKTNKERIVFVRGIGEIEFNAQKVNLSKNTIDFGLFSGVLKSLKAKKICFVENLQSFLNAENVITFDYVFIHFYGRLPTYKILKNIECEEYLHFGDYDATGLHEYLRAKECFPKASIYVPRNFDELFEKYSRERKDRDTIHNNVKESHDNEVIYIREKIISSGRFLEQQILFAEELL